MGPVALWGLLALIFVGLHYSFYFVWSFYEGGDLAANALQIRNAKAFKELYGNYSRFGFHHPGPAFVYVYAAAERLLFDLLKVVPTPFSAHSLAGVLLQLGFFTSSVWIVAKRIQRPLVLPLLLLFGAFYFGIVNHFNNNSAFQSIWPPHVLLMPFLCLLVAAASLATGETKELVPLVISGSFLVHGHVAQPLFVVPIATIAYIGWYRNRHDDAGFWTRDVRRSHTFAAAVLALFLLPLVIDAFRGEQSNLWLIIQHFTEHTGDRKTLAQSALYYLTFLCHVINPEKFCERLTWASSEFLQVRWYLLLMWVFVAVGTILTLRLARCSGSLGGPRFVRWLSIFFAISSGLTLVWGMLQMDALLEFNSHFNFAILFLVFILLGIGIASLPLLTHAKRLSGGVFAISLPLMFYASRNMSSQPDFPSQPPLTVELREYIRQAALNDPQRARAKFLLFDDWGEAARVGLTLTRLRYPFRVPAGWEPVFGRDKGVDLHRALSNPGYAIWKIKNASFGPGWLHTDVKEINPRGGEILFSTPRANAQEFLTSGWDISCGPYSWSVDTVGVIRFTPLPTQTDVRIECELASASEAQGMVMTFNGGPSKAFDVYGATIASLDVPASVWNERPAAVLKFDFPTAMSPLARGTSADPRQLGCAFVRIRFTPTP